MCGFGRVCVVRTKVQINSASKRRIECHQRTLMITTDVANICLIQRVGGKSVDLTGSVDEQSCWVKV
ncbi:MAG: hypothetical protein ACK55I_43325 [bacterium]